MEFLIRTQTLIFLQACLLGALLGILYDIFKTIRMLFLFPKFLVIISDIIYSVVVIVFTFSFALGFNDGRLRAFILLGEFLGIALYFCTISIVIMKIVKFFIILIRKVVKNFFKILFAPIIWIFKFITKILTKTYSFFKHALGKIEKNIIKYLKYITRVLYNKVIGKLREFKKVKLSGSEKAKEE